MVYIQFLIILSILSRNKSEDMYKSYNMYMHHDLKLNIISNDIYSCICPYVVIIFLQFLNGFKL